jgi:hypothetical protein
VKSQFKFKSTKVTTSLEPNCNLASSGEKPDLDRRRAPRGLRSGFELRCDHSRTRAHFSIWPHFGMDSCSRPMPHRNDRRRWKFPHGNSVSTPRLRHQRSGVESPTAIRPSAGERHRAHNRHGKATRRTRRHGRSWTPTARPSSSAAKAADTASVSSGRSERRKGGRDGRRSVVAEATPIGLRRPSSQNTPRPPAWSGRPHFPPGSGTEGPPCADARGRSRVESRAPAVVTGRA